MTQPTWIYHPTEPAKIVELARGDDAPEGWSLSASVILDPAHATAEAITARAAGRELPRAVDDVPAPAADAPLGPTAEDLLTVMARISELEGVIQAGMAENDRLAAELSTADDAVDDAAAAIEHLKADLAARDRATENLTAQIVALSADLEAAKAAALKLQDEGEVSRLRKQLAASESERERLERRLSAKSGR